MVVLGYESRLPYPVPFYALLGPVNLLLLLTCTGNSGWGLTFTLPALWHTSKGLHIRLLLDPDRTGSQHKLTRPKRQLQLNLRHSAEQQGPRGRRTFPLLVIT